MAVKHPPRSAREAKLEFAAERLRLEKTKQHPDKTLLPHIDVNLVHVREVDPPADTTPIEPEEDAATEEDTEPVDAGADACAHRWPASSSTGFPRPSGQRQNN